MAVSGELMLMLVIVRWQKRWRMLVWMLMRMFVTQ